MVLDEAEGGENIHDTEDERQRVTEELLTLVRRSGPTFQADPGLHSDRYMQCAALFEHPRGE